jgi:hypothetical protein
VLSAVRRWFKANPRKVFLVVAGLVILGIFLAVITPLFATSGPPMAILGGTLPTTAPADRPLEIDLEFDNVGDPVIGRICVGVLVQGPLTPRHAIFQNIDTEPFVDGKACGGSLSSQESISVQLFFDAGSAGTVQLVLSPMNGTRTIGAALSGSLSVAGP